MSGAGPFGVACPRREAMEIGLELLRRGGGAMDAAVAMSFAQGVAEPYMGGIGGVGEIVFCDAGGTVHVFDCAARAPLAARAEMYELVEGTSGVYPWPRTAGDANARGARSVTAPRIVPGLSEAQRRFGKLAWEEVVHPAAALARDGVELDYFSAAVLAAEMSTLAADELAGDLYYPNGAPLPPALEEPPVRVRNERLARSLETIAERGGEAMRTGPLARATVEAIAEAGGILVMADLERSEPVVLEDVAPLVAFHGWDVYGSPLPSGGVTAAEILGLLDRWPAAPGPESPERYRQVARASHLAFADRLTLLSGDDRQAALALLEPHTLDRRAGDDLGASPGIAAGPSRPTATTHAVAVDETGAVAVVTQTLLALFGAQLGVAEHGFFLNDGMLWFDPRPGQPTSIAPGARALSAVAPMVAMSQEDRGRRIGVAGLGARRIPTAVAQVLENVADYGMDVARAVDAPRVHVDTFAATVDQRLGAEVLEALAKDGHEPTVGHYGPTSLTSARASAVYADLANGEVATGVDQRARAVWDFGNERRSR
jgi:gamma-glutamyltranspeptidase/glutathione hydrolase